MSQTRESERAELDPTMTVASIHAIFNAYDDFSGSPWSGAEDFAHVHRVTGWAVGVEERFGLIFERASDPSTWLVAFRGTASFQDGLQDLMLRQTNFTPFECLADFPQDVSVAAGFLSIYADKGRSMTDSMQAQLFAALDRGKPKKLYVTGHSLGGALASLFALDVATCRSDVEITSITLASPRVGDDRWQTVYNDAYGLERSTFRVANDWDPVPNLPFAALGYTHVGRTFGVSFFAKEGKLPEPPAIIESHTLKNYRHVLTRAVASDPQKWHGEFVSDQGRTIRSG